jgi:dTDP-4-dehydrorhamnose reductase
MRLLVVGANGLLGSNVVSAARQRGLEVSGTYHSTEPAFDVPLAQFDLQKPHTFDALLDEYEPDVVVNCAAMTDVDGCEANPDVAHAVNGEAPGEMAARCEASGTEFVHISTDYVFDGDSREPYSETATPNPVQVYGTSKHAGEQAVQNEMEDALVLRLSFVWGIHRGTGELTGFPAWVQDQLASGEDVPLFTDQWITPTRAGQAADTLLGLAERNGSGLYHVACRTCATPYEFGENITDQVGAESTSLSEGSMKGIEREATRPTYTCLDVEKVETALGRQQPTLREDIEVAWDAVD